VAVREDVAAAVDALLRGYSLPPEIRVRRPSGEIEKLAGASLRPAAPEPEEELPVATQAVRTQGGRLTTLRVYPYGLNQNRVRQAGRHLNLPVALVNDLNEADALFTLRTYYRKKPQPIVDAERRGIPVYVLRNNTVAQMESYLAEIFGLSRESDMLRAALEEAREAIEQVSGGVRDSAQLSPQEAYVRRMQHELAREANLFSRSSGTDPHRSVVIYGDR